MFMRNLLFMFVAVVTGMGIDLILMHVLDEYFNKLLNEDEFYLVGLILILVVVIVFIFTGYIQL